MGESHTSTQILRARTAAGSRSAWIATIAIPLMLLAPALWNGYPLLQWDTGGYLARWYEGYLVPSRSTTFGLYLHFGEDSSFWINLGINTLATLWILQLTLRVLGQSQPLRLLAMSLVLVLTTSPPWLASTLLTDIFAGLSVLALFILVKWWQRKRFLKQLRIARVSVEELKAMIEGDERPVVLDVRTRSSQERDPRRIPRNSFRPDRRCGLTLEAKQPGGREMGRGARS